MNGTKLKKLMDVTVAKAVKEFAEKLKEKIKSLKVAEDEYYIFKCGFYVLQKKFPEIIDELLKEYEK